MKNEKELVIECSETMAKVELKLYEMMQEQANRDAQRRS